MLKDDRRVIAPDASASQATIASAQPAFSVAVAGAGFMGRVHGIAARSAGATVVGALASSPERELAAAQTVGARAGFSHIDDLLAIEGLDIVHVCLPNHLHFDVAMAAIQAGKHVVCEKPLAVDPGQARQLVDAAAAAGVVAAVPFVYRFHPMVREMRSRVLAGAAGDIGLLHGSYLQDWLAASDEYNWRVDPSVGGQSRTFADIGSHWFDLLEFVTGDRVAALSARFSTVNKTRRLADGTDTRVTTEDSVTVQFTTEAGRIGSFAASQVAAGRKNRLLLEVSGNAASFSFDQEKSEELWMGDALGHRVLVKDPATLSAEAGSYASVPAGHSQGYQDAFNAFARDVYGTIGAVDDSVTGLPTFADGLRSAEIIDAVIRSKNSDGTWIDVARSSR